MKFNLYYYMNNIHNINTFVIKPFSHYEIDLFYKINYEPEDCNIKILDTVPPSDESVEKVGYVCNTGKDAYYKKNIFDFSKYSKYV